MVQIDELAGGLSRLGLSRLGLEQWGPAPEEVWGGGWAACSA